MSWLRDNWLDALIFLLFALVVGGIVLFLTGVNPLRKSTAPETTPPPAVTAPANPAPQSEATPTTPEPEAITPEPEPEPEPTPTITVRTPQIPAPSTPKPAATQAPTTPKPATTPAPSTSSAPGNWQVNVGAFGKVQNAETLAQTLRNQGYSVRLSTAGNLTRVTVGPYPNEQRARSVATALGEYGAQAVRADSGNSATPVTSPAPATPPVVVTPSEPGSVLFQVGAFRSEAGAQATLKQLQQAGYSTVLVNDGNLFKVRVSVSGERREQAKANLTSEGFEPIEVRP